MTGITNKRVLRQLAEKKNKEFKKLREELQTKDAEIERLKNRLVSYKNERCDFRTKVKSQDTLIKELIEFVQLVDKDEDYLYSHKYQEDLKALLNSEAVKEWKCTK